MISDNKTRGCHLHSSGIPFWPASITGMLVLEACISSDPPTELATELIDIELAVEPRRGR